MKTILSLSTLVIVISLSSCKKTYTCQCVKSGNVTYTTSVVAKSSSTAKSNCSVNDNNTYGTCTIK